MNYYQQNTFQQNSPAHTMGDLTTEFNRYFNGQVQLCREEKTAAYNEAMPIIETLVKYVHKQDPRFGSEVIKVGSAFQGLKVGEPNEYDVNIPLTGLNSYSWGPYTPRYYDLTKGTSLSTSGPVLPPNYNLQQKIKRFDEVVIFETSNAQPGPKGAFTFVPATRENAMWLNSDDVVFQGDMIPILLKKTFRKLLNEGVRELGLRGKVSIDKKFHGPAIMMKIDRKDYNITIDMSIVVDRAAVFPDYAGWPHPQTSWPSGQKKDIISNIGISLVARKDLQWMVSPALAEREIMKGIDEDEGCRKKSHRIMKKLNEDLWTRNGKAISSYALKNLLLWECESFPRSSDWIPAKMAERILSMTRKLLNHISQEELKVYFVPQRNLFKKDTEAERSELHQAKDRIQEFLNNPVPTMQMLNTES